MIAFGVKTAKLCPGTLVSDETSTETGHTCGPSPAGPRRIPALRTTKVESFHGPGFVLLASNHNLFPTGLGAGDAPETVVLSSYLNKIKAIKGLKLFIDFHSYSQLFMSRKYFPPETLPV